MGHVDCSSCRATDRSQDRCSHTSAQKTRQCRIHLVSCACAGTDLQAQVPTAHNCIDIVCVCHFGLEVWRRSGAKSAESCESLDCTASCCWFHPTPQRCHYWRGLQLPHPTCASTDRHGLSALLCGQPGSRRSDEKYFIWGYYGTHSRVRLYPPLGYNILCKEYNLTRFNHQKTIL